MRISTHVVGRSSELAQIQVALDEVLCGESRVVVIQGETGIGKTLLAEECLAIARRRGFQVAVGRTWEGPGAPALLAWRAAFGALGRSFELEPSPSGRTAVFSAIERVTREAQTAAAETPVAIVLDDVQWADASTLLALRMAARATLGRVLVIATLRVPEPVAPSIDGVLQDVLHDAHLVLKLSGLHEHDLVKMPEAHGVDERVVVTIHRVSGGNPLFAKELLLDASARASLAAGGDLVLPAGVRAILSRRLAMTAEAVEVLACAALGPQSELDTELIARVADTPRETTQRAFEAAMTTGLVVRAVTGGLVFAHDLMRAAALEQLSASRRAELHAAWADVLEATADPQLEIAAAFHAIAADPLGARHRTRERALRSGLRALSRMGHADAATLFEAVAAAELRANRHGEAARARACLAHALTYGGDPERGRAAAEHAVALARRANDPGALAQAASALTLKRHLGGADMDAISVLDEALRGLDASPPEDVDTGLRCEVEARLAAALQPLVDPPRALSLARTAISRARGTRNERLLARTLNAARPAFRPVDSLAERLEIDSELIYLASKYGDRRLAAQARERLCYLTIERGDATALDEHIDVYGKVADELGVARHEVGVTSLRALRAIIRGDFLEARAFIDKIEATRARWSIANPIESAIDRVLELRCAVSLATDDPAGIRALAMQPMPRLRRQMCGLLAAVRSGDRAGATELYEQVADRVLSPSSANFTFRSILAEAMVFLRDHARARQLYELLTSYGGRHVIWTPAPVYGGSIDRLRAGLALLAGDRDAAAAHFADAIRAEESFGAHPFAARTRNEREAAVPTRCGELIDQHALHIKRTWGLTPRQLEVALLVARGESNHAISAKLGCAERTVEVHITAVLRKAGVTSRTELAAQFWRSGHGNDR